MTLAEVPPRAEENPRPVPMDPHDAFWARVLAAIIDMLALSFVYSFVNFVYRRHSGYEWLTHPSPWRWRHAVLDLYWCRLGLANNHLAGLLHQPRSALRRDHRQVALPPARDEMARGGAPPSGRSLRATSRALWTRFLASISLVEWSRCSHAGVSGSAITLPTRWSSRAPRSPRHYSLQASYVGAWCWSVASCCSASPSAPFSSTMVGHRSSCKVWRTRG